MLVLTVLGALFAVHGEAAGQQPKAKEAAVAPKARELAVAVTGLSKENAAAVREDLLALSTQVYSCSACEVEQSSAGTCPKCKAALQPEARALFTSVGPSMQDNLIAFTFDPRVVVRLSQIESALGKRTVKIDDERFTLGGRAQLLVRGSLPDDTSSIEKALADAKLFDEVKVAPDLATNQITVSVRAEKNGPTRAKVAAALEGIKAHLTDIVWIPPIAKS